MQILLISKILPPHPPPTNFSLKGSKGSHLLHSHASLSFYKLQMMSSDLSVFRLPACSAARAKGELVKSIMEVGNKW